MSQAESNEPSSWIEILIGIGICAILALMFLPSMFPSVLSEKGNGTKCKNNLKQFGLVIHSYYNESDTTALPILKRYAIEAANDGGFGFDANMLCCPAQRQDHSMHYVWNPKISGGTWAEWSTPHSPLIWDASPHKFNDKINVLFGDGHVEELTPERLRELTR